MKPSCRLLGTLGCHLCEEAEAILLPFAARGVEIELIDIAESEAMVERYGLLIPVLQRCDTGSELHWPFDTWKVVEFLELDAEFVS